MRRFWAHQREEIGHIVHKRGNVWAFHYDIHGDPSHDEAGFRFASHTFLPGEYVSLKEQDDVLRTFRVVSVRASADPRVHSTPVIPAEARMRSMRMRRAGTLRQALRQSRGPG